MPINPELGAATVVMVGTFNPAIFHPSWFGQEGLLRKEEAERPEVKVVSEGIAVFRAGWLSVEVTTDRFSASTTDGAMYPVLRDLVVGTFRLLRHTPVALMGLNISGHFVTDSAETWKRIKSRIAPEDAWMTLLDHPEIRSTTVQGRRSDEYKGYVRVQVEPSVKLPNGVFISVNDHYQLVDEPETIESAEPDMRPTKGLATALSILMSKWEDSFSMAERIREGILQYDE